MPFPSLVKIAATLSEADILRLLVLKRVGPKLEKLEARRKKIADQLAEVQKELMALTGGATPKAPGKRGRKPGRPAKATGTASAKVRNAPAIRGPKAVKKAKPAKAKQPVDADARRAKLLENLAKARAARAAKRAAAQ